VITYCDSVKLIIWRLDQVYLAAVVDYIPMEMTQCLASFLELFYIFWRNAITTTALNQAKEHLNDFRRHREIFVTTGTRAHCSLPRQHALGHFLTGIPEFGASNGHCSPITESKHIEAVKKPWRRSSRFDALHQMLKIIVRVDKLSTLHQLFMDRGMLQGSTSMYMALTVSNNWQPLVLKDSEDEESNQAVDDEPDDPARMGDVTPADGPRLATSVTLARTHRKPSLVVQKVVN
jgi:hypothetical protein